MPLLGGSGAFGPFDKRAVTVGRRSACRQSRWQPKRLPCNAEDATPNWKKSPPICCVHWVRHCIRVSFVSNGIHVSKQLPAAADYRQKLILLNPRLLEYPAEIDRTLRHELAHMLAQFRAGRRKILAHGDEWRVACCDLGIADEKRCHNLRFPVRKRARRFLYECPELPARISARVE